MRLALSLLSALRARLKSAKHPPGATFLLCLAALVLPNTLALVGSACGVGLPPRTLAISLYASLGLFVGVASRITLVIAFLLVVVYDLTSTVSASFFLSEGDLIGMLPAGLRVAFLSSPFYAAAAASLLFFVSCNAALLAAKRGVLAHGSRTVFVALTLAYIGFDVWQSPWSQYENHPFASVGHPFESAVSQSGFAALADTPSGSEQRHVLLVLVESLGILRDPAQQALLFAAFRDPELLKHYDVTTGKTTFFGATAYGEVRELCHTRDLRRIVDGSDDPVCLPDLFRESGYRTVAVHGFSDTIYNRGHWYPKLGFDRSVFQENLRHSYSRHCGGPFVGPCDVDLAKSIGDRIGEIDATPPHQSLFLYWLTLNTHVPVRIEAGSHRWRCKETGGGPFGDAEVCTMAELWSDLFEAVNAVAMQHGPLEILLVGDHAPPLWRRSARELFEPGHVPWIRLTPRVPRVPLVTTATLQP